ncbi:MAG: DUF2273 domain-containing protein [Thermoflavifilum sp.]|nr:DUF2273 domain-containing protein [Thermoflavifilum sp.]MCL6514014.1 DUF2273 domain-containing protein [Alicyclobacillus sp.]
MEHLEAAWRAFRQLKRRWHGLIAGCLLWLIWMVFGFWATLLLIILGGVGFVVGRIMEENESWKDVIDKLLSERFDG